MAQTHTRGRFAFDGRPQGDYHVKVLQSLILPASIIHELCSVYGYSLHTT